MKMDAKPFDFVSTISLMLIFRHGKRQADPNWTDNADRASFKLLCENFIERKTHAVGATQNAFDDETLLHAFDQMFAFDEDDVDDDYAFDVVGDDNRFKRLVTPLFEQRTEQVRGKLIPVLTDADTQGETKRAMMLRSSENEQLKLRIAAQSDEAKNIAHEIEDLYSARTWSEDFERVHRMAMARSVPHLCALAVIDLAEAKRSFLNRFHAREEDPPPGADDIDPMRATLQRQLDMLKIGLKYTLLKTDALLPHHEVLSSIVWNGSAFEILDSVATRDDSPGIHVIRSYDFAEQSKNLGSCVPTTVYNCLAYLLGEGRGDVRVVAQKPEYEKCLYDFVAKVGFDWSDKKGAPFGSLDFQDGENIERTRAIFHATTDRNGNMLSDLYRLTASYTGKVPKHAVAAFLTGRRQGRDFHAMLTIKHDGQWCVVDPHCPFKRVVAGRFPTANIKTCAENGYNFLENVPSRPHPGAYVIERKIHYNLSSVLGTYDASSAVFDRSVPELVADLDKELSNAFDVRHSYSPFEGEAPETTESGQVQVMLGYDPESPDAAEEVFFRREEGITSSILRDTPPTNLENHVFTTYAVLSPKIGTARKRQRVTGGSGATRVACAAGIAVTVLSALLGGRRRPRT